MTAELGTLTGGREPNGWVQVEEAWPARHEADCFLIRTSKAVPALRTQSPLAVIPVEWKLTVDDPERDASIEAGLSNACARPQFELVEVGLHLLNLEIVVGLGSLRQFERSVLRLQLLDHVLFELALLGLLLRGVLNSSLIFVLIFAVKSPSLDSLPPSFIVLRPEPHEHSTRGKSHIVQVLGTCGDDISASHPQSLSFSSEPSSISADLCQENPRAFLLVRVGEELYDDLAERLHLFLLEKQVKTSPGPRL